MARYEPASLNLEPLEQLQQARRADLPREDAAPDVVRGILAAVRAKPAGNCIDIDAEYTVGSALPCGVPSLAVITRLVFVPRVPDQPAVTVWS